nr:MAG TPA: hypothetical protein [Caudoviricetes sp.]
MTGSSPLDLSISALIARPQRVYSVAPGNAMRRDE